MTGDEPMVSILREIRDEIRTTRTDLGSEIGLVREELRNEIRLVREELRHEIRENTTRVEHVENALLDLAEQQRFVVRWLKGRPQHDQSVNAEIVGIKGRLDAVEERLDER